MSPRDGSANRDAILDTAERLVLDHGFAGTGVDRLIAEVGTTKGAFFHHFASKQRLAEALIRRWDDGDRHHLEDKMARAEALVDDPLQQVLVFLGLFIEEAEEYAGQIPGCLFAAYSYQAGQFDDAVREVLNEAMLRWRRRLRAKLDDVVERHPPVVPVDLDAVADVVTTVFEGSYVVSRAVQDGRVVVAQLALLRTHLALMFGAERSGSSLRP